MSYRTDQWFNLFKTGITGEPGNPSTAVNKAGYFIDGPTTNRPFIYPDRVIRNMGGRDRESGGTRPNYLKRGYIRNLSLGTEDTSLGTTPLRCQFQFNPVTIMQTVQQAQGVLNFLQQDIAQFAQPLMGQNSFAFELLFDRSMELNTGDESIRPDIDFSSDDLWAQLPPQTGGVLHDLSRLYSILGVGLSQELVDYATNVYTRQAEAEATSSLQSGDTAAPLNTLDTNESTLETRLPLNVGNSAILMPLPVRVVFSSLYVIEGLVSGLSIRFSKFNSAMIPMQCAVTVSMQAMYVGFARRKTFFQEALQQLATYERQDITDQQAEYDAVSSVSPGVKEELSVVNLALYESGGTKGKKFSDDAAVTLSDITSHFTRTVGGGHSKGGNWEQDTTLKVYFPNVYSKGVKNSSVYNTMTREALTVEVEWAHIRIYRYLVRDDKYLYTLDQLKDAANESARAGKQIRRLYAHDDEDDDDAGPVNYEVYDHELIREVILNKDKVGGRTPGITSVSTLDSIEEFFGGNDGSDSLVYSIQQKGIDDRLSVRNSSEQYGRLIIDNVPYDQGSAIEGTDNTTKVRFSVQARVVVAITDKNGTREKKEAYSSMTISSPQSFHTNQLKFSNMRIEWNTGSPPDTTPEVWDNLGRDNEVLGTDFTDIAALEGLDYIP